MLVLAVRGLPEPDAGAGAADVAQGIADALRREQPHALVERRELEGGPVVVVRRAGTLRFTGGTESVDTVSVQVLIPAPDLDELVVLDVSTSHVATAEPVAGLAVAIADTVRFTRSAIAGRLDG
jgi:hypothetical protein